MIFLQITITTMTMNLEQNVENPEALGKRVFTTGEAAKICKISQQTIIRCFDAAEGSKIKLKGFRVPGSRFRRIPRDSLFEFMKENGIPTDALENGSSKTADESAETDTHEEPTTTGQINGKQVVQEPPEKKGKNGSVEIVIGDQRVELPLNGKRDVGAAIREVGKLANATGAKVQVLIQVTPAATHADESEREVTLGIGERTDRL